MIRRDYILRMIEEFIRALSRINALKQKERWGEAATELDGEFERLIGSGAQTAAGMSETELLGLLMKDTPTLVLRQKTLILTSLLKEAGDVAAAQNRSGEATALHLKSLNLLLEVLLRDEVEECPAYVPKVEALINALAEVEFPARTLAMLMQHFERLGDFARAEDALFHLADASPDNPALIEVGGAFYRRLLARSDEALARGNLPRAEVEAGLQELEGRRARR